MEKSIQENLDKLYSLLLDSRIDNALPHSDFEKLFEAFSDVQESVWNHAPIFPREVKNG